MAVTATKKASSLIIEVEADTAADGSTIYAQRTIGRINPAASDEDCFDFATAVGTLQSAPVGNILRSEKSILDRA